MFFKIIFYFFLRLEYSSSRNSQLSWVLLLSPKLPQKNSRSKNLKFQLNGSQKKKDYHIYGKKLPIVYPTTSDTNNRSHESIHLSFNDSHDRIKSQQELTTMFFLCLSWRATASNSRLCACHWKSSISLYLSLALFQHH